jgi:hypothetical protein
MMMMMMMMMMIIIIIIIRRRRRRRRRRRSNSGDRGIQREKVLGSSYKVLPNISISLLHKFAKT